MVMNRNLWIILSSFLLMAFNPFSSTSSMQTEIQVEVHEEMAVENQPLFAKLIIAHPEHEIIDESSIKIDGKPLKNVQLISEGSHFYSSLVNSHQQSMSQKISYYIFEIEDTSRGKHTLAPISAFVGDKKYTSQPVDYYISETQISRHFSLDAFVDAPKTLYPGQNFTVCYRVKKSKLMEPFFENLPLLDLKFCQKKGKQQRKSYCTGNQRVDEFYQMFQAKEVGQHKIEGSFIEARQYQEDFFGRRRYSKNVERAEAQDLEIVVSDFPSAEKPKSFNGAVGQFEVEATIVGNSQVCLGDKIKLQVTFKGDEGLSTVQLPKLSLQPQLKDAFRFSDLPVTAKQESEKKVFACELRPMKEGLTEVPSIEFSYFDPKNEQYHVLYTNPLAITILPMKTQAPLPPLIVAQNLDEQQKEQAIETPIWVEVTEPELIDIQGIYPLNEKKLKVPKAHYFEYEIAIFLLLAFIIQLLIKLGYDKRKKKKGSSHYFQCALKGNIPLQKYQLMIEKALLLRLQEQNFIKDVTSVEQLGTQGICGEVKSFIQEMQIKLFSKGSHFSMGEFEKKAKTLYKKIGGLS